MRYNPSLSVRENARNNGTTEDAVRYFIRSMHIDRRYERKVALLISLRFLSGRDRHRNIYGRYPPVRIYVYMKRICIAKNADFEKYNDPGQTGRYMRGMHGRRAMQAPQNSDGFTTEKLVIISFMA